MGIAFNGGNIILGRARRGDHTPAKRMREHTTQVCRKGKEHVWIRTSDCPTPSARVSWLSSAYLPVYLKDDAEGE